MKKYKVDVCFTAWSVVEVVAETEADAKKQACADFSTYGCSNIESDISNSYIITEEDV